MNAHTRLARAALLGVVLPTLLAAGGCGEVMFKRGAGPGEMQNTQAGCRQKSADEDAYATCLRAAGFVYEKPGEGGVLFSAPVPVATDAAATTESAAPAAAGAAAPAAAGGLTATVEPAGRAGASQAAPKPAPQLPADPLAKVKVASWWKLGGNAGGLAADQASCAASLGDAHRMDPNARTATVGMVGCLRGKGWFAVGQ